MKGKNARIELWIKVERIRQNEIKRNHKRNWMQKYVIKRGKQKTGVNDWDKEEWKNKQKSRECIFRYWDHQILCEYLFTQ